MGKTVSLTCDCGCGASVADAYNSGWLVLSQPYEASDNLPKLSDDLCFSGLACLAEWSQKAASAALPLQEAARSLYWPRGALSRESVPGLFV